jgi:hypothetical protein
MLEDLDLQRDIARGVNEGMRSAEQEALKLQETRDGGPESEEPLVVNKIESDGTLSKQERKAIRRPSTKKGS